MAYQHQGARAEERRWKHFFPLFCVSLQSLCFEEVVLLSQVLQNLL